MHDKAARGQGPGRACEAAARGQAAHLPSSLRQQAGREGPQETPSPCCATLQELHGEGVLSLRHEDLHAPGPRMKINQPKCMCRASQGKGGMLGACADAKISLGDAFLYG